MRRFAASSSHILSFVTFFSSSPLIDQGYGTLGRRINSVAGFVFSDRLFALGLNRLLSEI